MIGFVILKKKGIVLFSLTDEQVSRERVISRHLLEANLGYRFQTFFHSTSCKMKNALVMRANGAKRKDKHSSLPISNFVWAHENADFHLAQFQYFCHLNMLIIEVFFNTYNIPRNQYITNWEKIVVLLVTLSKYSGNYEKISKAPMKFIHILKLKKINTLF